ncbi:MAG: hypothetical protein HQK49_19285 [Oligoflexia bacterium]|nr:hypothetical protein [Oligoflexia bacterium]
MKRFLCLSLMLAFSLSFSLSSLYADDFDGGYYSYCQSLPTARDCVNNPSCFWDVRSNMCFDRNNPNPNPNPNPYPNPYPQPMSCRDHYNQYNCQQDRNCSWSFVDRMCVDGWDQPNPNPQPYNCNFLRNPNSCNRNYNCQWDYRFNRCERKNQHPYPMDCRMIRNSRQCMSTPGCAWDTIRNFCMHNPYGR